MGCEIREQINQDLNAAVKAQNKRCMSTLRLIKAALKDRDIAARTAGKDDGVSDADVLDILAKMVKQRRESTKIYEEAGRIELATQEQEEIDVIQDYLPKQLGEAEMKAVCQAVVAELDATGLKDMGRTMGALKERYAGQMDFGKASAVVKALLGG
jgi:uncharacterized protein